ncbi:Mercuric reductase [Pirellulimonas nuda]|uniref:Mercuric reductase n=1 Tax=Pirellulimonas nuda TaxID=2528009 RepID=A0A518D5N2_9BACT|nr:mercuric reductase [Pirellulimonas nuda]QDU86770.1 Mercuric reductase [Pirellulimonas nuda]
MIELEPPTPANRRLAANVHPAGWTNTAPEGRYHLVVIGAGTAGLVAASVAAGLGARVALVERRLMGGDCLNVGCVPSKGLIAAARAAAAGASVEFSAAMERMREVRADISVNDSAQRFREKGVDVYFGDARFVDRQTIAVDDCRLRFRRAIIATGARAMAPPIPGLDSARYLTNESVFSLTELPASLGVIGAGPIGCELAQAFARLGSRVHLISDSADAGGPTLLPREDPEAAAIVREALRRDGVSLHSHGKQVRVARDGEQTRVECDASPDYPIVVEKLLVAAGRAPNVEGMGLEDVGIEFDPKQGVKVDDRLRTTNARVFAAGDVCSEYKFTHAADFQARLAVRNALMPWPLNRGKASGLVIPWCTYTTPELAHVGLTQRGAAKQNTQLRTFRQELAEVDRSLLAGETEGFVKIHLHAKHDRILGATIVAPHAGELIGELSLAMTHGLGLGKIATAIHPYPTVAEAIRKCGDAYNRTRLTPTVKRVLDAWLRLTR